MCVATDPLDHGTVIVSEPLQVKGIQSLCYIVKRMQAVYTLPCTLGERCQVVRAGKSFLNFPQAMQDLEAMTLSQPTVTQHVT